MRGGSNNEPQQIFKEGPTEERESLVLWLFGCFCFLCCSPIQQDVLQSTGPLLLTLLVSIATGLRSVPHCSVVCVIALMRPQRVQLNRTGL